jgi:hypothetical protein
MPEHLACETPLSNLLEHPAVRAWCTLKLRRPAPTGLVTLKTSSKSGVYRLEGAGPADSAVIAKRCPQTTAVVERIIYEEVLPFVPLPTLRYFGFVEEQDSDFCWLFLEDAGSEQYSPDLEEHCQLSGRWLGVLHASAARVAAAARLPGRGPGHYLEHLQSARFTLREILHHPRLDANGLAILESLISHFDFLESHWSLIERFCAGIPQTLVHGDIAVKNVRIRTRAHGIDLFPFDWETAGWGVPAIDLFRRIRHSVCPDLSVYESIVQRTWGRLADQDIQQLAKFGSLFRLLAAVSWASSEFVYQWWLKQKLMPTMRYYATAMGDHLSSLSFPNSSSLPTSGLGTKG